MSHAIALRVGGKPGWLATFRTRRLTRDRARRRAATGIERAIAAAERPPQRFSSAIPVARSAVLACRSQLVELAERLRSPEPVYAQGVALVFELLTDSGSALYQVDGELELTIENIFAALDGNVE